MTSRATSLVLGTVTCMIAGGSMVTMHLGSAGAADECLAAPRKETPAGQHWYFKFDRSTKRRCWYLNDAGEAVAHAAKSRPARRAASVAEQGGQNPPSHPPADALAEWPQARAADTLRNEDTTIAAPTEAPHAVEADDSAQQTPASAAAETPQSAVAARWPESASVASSVNEPAPASVAVASATPDAAPDAAATTVAAPGVAVPPMTRPDVVAPPPADTTKTADPAMPADSVYALLMAVGGTLMLVGFTGLATFLVTERRRQARREAWAPQRGADPARLPTWLDPAAANPRLPRANRLDEEIDEIERLLAHQARS